MPGHSGLDPFFIVGAAVSGTTSLYRYLGQHPQIFTPERKEVHFFSDYPPSSAPRYETVDDYLAHFSGCGKAQLPCDASTSYLYSRSAAGRISGLWPGSRVIMILRNPIERAYSLYWNNRRDCLERESFEDALALEEQRIRDGWSFGYHYVRSGLYFEQVERYLKHFGGDRVKIFLFEEFRRDPEAVCREVFDFLGISREVDVDTRSVHNKTGPPRSDLLARVMKSPFPGRRHVVRALPLRFREAGRALLDRNVLPKPLMHEATRRWLQRQFAADIGKLELVLGKDLAHWS